MDNQAYDPHVFIDKIAAVSRADKRLPDPIQGIGRECYAFSEQEDRAHQLAVRAIEGILRERVKGQEWMLQKDEIGNLFVTFFGTDTSRRAFMMHSHLDSVLNGGMYDGVAGVASALDVLRDIVSEKRLFRRDYRVGVFRSEESSPRNGYGCLGSAVATGTIPVGRLQTIKYSKDVPLHELLKDRWAGIIDELRHPEITPRNTCGCFEVHIEQSDFIVKHGADVGIVVGAIGGAWRERVQARPVATMVVHKRTEEYVRLRLDFFGVADHTGNTPPNRRFAQGPHLRKDALVASCVVTRRLLRAGALLISSLHVVEAGFTSVPMRQTVELIVNAERMPAVVRLLRTLKRRSLQGFGVRMRYRTMPYRRHDIKAVGRADAMRCLEIAPRVSALATKAFQRQATEFGKTRATVTDFRLSPSGLSFKLDGRETDAVEGAALEGEILELWRELFGSLEREEVSRKRSQPVDEEMVRVLEEVCIELGVKYIKMPSGAGHDTDRMIAAGIGGAMLFVAQNDGVSHSPFERMETAHFNVANKVARVFVRRMLER